jgi:5'-3' exonuclease
VRADDDAEKLVAQLNARGVVDYAASGDGDTLAFGAPQLLRDLDPRKTSVTVVDLDAIIAALSLRTMQGFVDLAIMSGNDMHKLDGIGVTKALQLLHKFGTPEGALASAANFRLHPPPADFNVAQLRERFMSPCIAGADIDVGPAAEVTTTAVDTKTAAPVAALQRLLQRSTVNAAAVAVSITKPEIAPFSSPSPSAPVAALQRLLRK